MTSIGSAPVITKLPTGIPGFDFIAEGGLPQSRITLVSGTTGSGKTLFASQFLAEGIRQYGEPGVFVTFEEPPAEVSRNVESFGWNVAEWQSKQFWTYVDASPDVDQEIVFGGDYDLEALIRRIRHAIDKVHAKRVVLDSISAIFSQFADSTTVRRELFKIAASLRGAGVTTVITAERTADYGEIARYGVEEFVSDNVVILRNSLEETRRRRTVEILKFRGTSHSKGEYPFSVLPDRGIVIIPLSAIELSQKSYAERRTSGNGTLDEMCGGGFFRDAIVLISGPTGTGKTLLTTQFVAGAARGGERVLLFAFEEGHNQLVRNASGWGVDLTALEAEGNLRIVSAYPEVAGLEDHLIRMKHAIDEFNPDRIAVDSLSALERVASQKGFREFVVSLTSFIKDNGLMALFTATTPTLLGGTSATEAHISTITDTIVLLRYVEISGEMHRGITVLKMRGSGHDRRIREFIVNDTGMHIRNPFERVVGVLSGNINIISEGGFGASGSLLAGHNNPEA